MPSKTSSPRTDPRRERAPQRGRPTVSPLVWVSAAAWAGSVAGTEAALYAWVHADARVLAAVALLGVSGTAVVMRLARPIAGWAAVAFLAAAMLAGARASVTATAASRLEASGPREWVGRVAEEPTSGRFGTTVRMRLDGVGLGTVVRVSWPGGAPTPRYGDVLAISARLRVADRLGPATPDAFRSGELLSAKPYRAGDGGPGGGVIGALFAWRDAHLDRLASIGGPGADALASMLFGAPGATSAAVLEQARTAGVAWLVVASGIHLGVMVLLAERAAALAGAGRGWRGAAAVVTTLTMCAFAGWRLSLLRAGLAGASGVAARLVGRRRDATAALALAVLVLLAASQGAAYDVGLALAVCAVGSLAVFSSLAQEWLAPVCGRTGARVLAPSVAAQAGVAPLAAALFGAVSPVGPLVLVASGPLVEAGVAVSLAGCAVGTVLPPAEVPILRVASAVVGAAVAIWGRVAVTPGVLVAVPAPSAAVLLAIAVAAAGLWLWWPTPRRAARVRIGVATMAVVVLLAGVGRAGVAPVLDVLDVGQGDAILIRDGGHAVLVDTGPDPAVLRQALSRAGCTSVEGVVLTHAHADHVGGLPGLAGLCRPAWIALPDVVDAATDGVARGAAARTDAVVRLRRGKTFGVGRLQVRVLWPRGGERRLSANDTSVVLLVCAPASSALLLGDAEEQAQRGALEAFSDRVDVVKVAHHGSENGSVPVALERWSPTLALISVGTGNPFGHPHAAALRELAAIGAVTRRTDLGGDLVWDGTGSRPAFAVNAAAALCDNPWRLRPRLDGRSASNGQVCSWPQRTSAISSRSISSTAANPCCWSARRSVSATAWPPSPTSTSTSTCSTAARSPPTTC